MFIFSRRTAVAPFECAIFLAAILAANSSQGLAQDFSPAPRRDQNWRVESRLEGSGISGNNFFFADFDKSGAAWLASSDGLFRYDGYDWRRFGKQDGLPSDFVRSVLVAADGQIWVGTDKGAAVGTGDKFEPLPVEAGVLGPSVRRIRQSRDGSLWFCSDRWPDASASGGLARLSGGRWTRYGSQQGLSGDYIVDFFEDSAGRWYTLTREGLAIWSGERWDFIVRQSDFPGTEWQSASMVEAPEQFAPPAQGVWIATGRHLFHVRGSRFQGVHGLPTGASYGLATASGNLVLTMVSRRGFRRFAEWNGTATRFLSGEFAQPVSGFLEQVLQAPDGSIWAIGWDTVVRWLPPLESWEEFSGLPPPRIEDAEGRIWFSGSRGTVVLNQRSSWRQFDTPASHLALDHEGGVWAVSGESVVRWLGNEQRRFSGKDTGMSIHTGIAADRQGVVWAYGATGEGR